MRPMLLATLLLMLSGTACSTNRVVEGGLDRAKLAECPRTIEAPGELVEREVLTIPDGRFAGMEVVPVGNANERENMLARGALVFKDGWLKCKSVVIYVEDRDGELAQ